MSRISEIIDLYMAIAKIPKAKFQKKKCCKTQLLVIFVARIWFGFDKFYFLNPMKRESGENPGQSRCCEAL